MFERIKRARQQSESGFTLIELLIVIVILGILSAIVVFAVSGISDRGQASACDTDESTLRTAQEAYYSKNKTYATEAELVTAKFLSQASSLHNVTLTGSGASATYDIVGIAPC